MGTEYPNRPTFPSRPASPFGAPQSTTPFQSSRPVVGSDASAFRPAPPPPPSPTMSSPSSSGPMVGPGISNFRPMPPGMPNDAGRPPPTSAPPYGQTVSGPFPRFPAPQFPSTAQVPPPRTSVPGQPVAAPVRPVSGPFSTPPVTHHPQIQPPTVPMGSPPPGVNTFQPSQNVHQAPMQSQFSAARATTQPSSPLAGSAYPAARPGFQSAFPGYINQQPSGFTQAPPRQSVPFPSQPGGYVPPVPAASSPYLAQQGGFAAPPPVTTQRPGSMPPTSAMQGLVEDFSSFSIGSVPGSFDSGLDSKVLPRPIEVDLERNILSEMYPMNCSSRFLRLTTSGIPNSQSLASRWHLSLGAVVCPLAEAPDGDEVPVVNFAPTGIIRCRRCRTYVNPYVTFTDSGRKWRCNICALLNEVPGEYFAHLDASGRRVDLDQRPELTKGSVEFIAPAEYMVRPPMPPLYFFLIDVSLTAVRSGMLEVLAQTIKNCLDNLPGFPRTQIGFITYDSTSSLTQPQMMVMSDLEDVFVPLPDDLLVNLSESRAVVDAFLDSLPSMFQDNMNVESAFGPALKTAFMVMVTLQELDNEMSRELMGLLKKQRESDRSYYQTCHLVRQGLDSAITPTSPAKCIIKDLIGFGPCFLIMINNSILSFAICHLPFADSVKRSCFNFLFSFSILNASSGEWFPVCSIFYGLPSADSGRRWTCCHPQLWMVHPMSESFHGRNLLLVLIDTIDCRAYQIFHVTLVEELIFLVMLGSFHTPEPAVHLNVGGMGRLSSSLYASAAPFGWVEQRERNAN
ncbi:Protein transport protein-like [Capsicum baccatum]|uniref:Protein transport protein-like n=1 Tax=Capsicum baccatum TaxID=33114 RepID=A0A2G2XFL0_CAPBA|nr:Protein transport protein-like [Capsicum baccatum]